MAKRVSLRGKGADIFFGDYQPAGPGESETPEAVAPPPTPPVTARPRKRAAPAPRRTEAVQTTTRPESAAVPAQASTNASTAASKHARLHASTQQAGSDAAVAEAPLATGALDAVLDYVAEPAAITNSFRYTEQELSSLTDALYEVGKRYGVKLTKQDVARLGLNLVLWDYRTRGEASLLGTLAQRRQRRRRDE